MALANKLLLIFNNFISLANNGCKIKTIKQLKNNGINQLTKTYVAIIKTNKTINQYKYLTKRSFI